MTDWQDDAACRGKNPEWWFKRPNGTGVNESATNKRAKEICRGCPVRGECLAFARANGERHGIWAGVWFDREWLDRRRLAS